jgi:transposase
MIPVTVEPRAEVEAVLRRRALNPRLREQLEMVTAAALGYHLAAIVAWSGRSPRTVRHWLRRFARGGIALLSDAPRPGRPAAADADYLRALAAAVETAPPTLGLPCAGWTSARLSA